MPRVYKNTKIVETPPENKTDPPPSKNKMEKVEPKSEPKKRSEPKHMETDPKVLHKHLKEKDKELSKIKMLLEKMVKVVDME